jgi:streptogramin lyase
VRGLHFIVATCLGAACLAACASGGTGVAPATESTVPNPNSFGLLQPIHRGAAMQHVKRDRDPYLRALYITTFSGNSVKIFTNTYYRELIGITSGISIPTGISIDQRGNLYVANGLGANITEYAPGGTSPIFTYNANMTAPYGVTVDRRGNVYEADANGLVVNQYFQGSNVASVSCSAPSGATPAGVAVDAGGDVFVSYSEGGGSGSIFEYSGGLSGCNGTLLNNFSANSITLDSNNNLICTSSSGGGSVFVLDPPYTAITRTIGSGFSIPSGASINKRNKLVYVADVGNETVTVIDYQTGANIKVLGASDGITQVFGVVDSPNAVY